MPNPSTLALGEEELSRQGPCNLHELLVSSEAAAAEKLKNIQPTFDETGEPSPITGMLAAGGRYISDLEVKLAASRKLYEDLYLKFSQVTSEQGLQISDLKGTVTILAADRAEASAHNDRVVMENNSLLELTRKLKRAAEAALRFRNLVKDVDFDLQVPELAEIADADADLEAKLEAAGYTVE